MRSMGHWVLDTEGRDAIKLVPPRMVARELQ